VSIVIIIVAVHGLKLEIRNLGDLSACGHAQAGMKRVYELYVYKLAEALSDMVWHDFDRSNKKGERLLIIK